MHQEHIILRLNVIVGLQDAKQKEWGAQWFYFHAVNINNQKDVLVWLD